MGIFIKRPYLSVLIILIPLVALCAFGSAPVMADDSLSSTAAVNTSTWPVSEEQAVEIASSCLPADAVEQAQISVTVINGTESGNEPYQIWVVYFSGLELTSGELGWQRNADDSIVFSSSEDIYDRIQIGVDAATGEVTLKVAWPQGIRLGSIPVAFKVIEPLVAKPSVFSSPYWRILGGVALFFVIVVGYLAVRMWFMKRAER